jgi:Ca2+:H+ antiporter
MAPPGPPPREHEWSHYKVAQNRVNQARPGPGGGLAGSWRDWIDPRKVGWLRLLLLAVPLALLLWGLAIIPLAGIMGEATERLSRRVGPGIGGLLNATFGNAAELIIALFALFNGLDEVVKASLTGSVIGNLLLVLGASLLAGGMRYPVQRFNRTAVGVGSTLAVLAAVGMVVPAIFHSLAVAHSPGPAESLVLENVEHKLSLAVAGILVLTYSLNLLFSLRTHKDLYNSSGDAEDVEGQIAPSVTRSTVELLVATFAVAVMSEVLVGAVHETSHALGLTEVFVGVIVVAVVGNAAEHSTAILMARKNQMDLAVGIAFGSALQIALFVTPVLVFASYLRAAPMDMLFSTMEVVAVILAVLIARMVAEDGESNWLEGAMLLMIYAILGAAFFFLPAPRRPQVPGVTHEAAAAGSPDRLLQTDR